MINHVFGRGGYFFLGEVLTKSSLFFITPVIINKLGDVQYAEFSLFVYLIPVLSIFMDLGLRFGIKRVYIQNPNELRDITNIYQTIPIYMLIILFISFNFIDIEYKYIYFLIFNSSFFSLLECFMSEFQIRNKVNSYNIALFFRNALPYYLFITLVLSGLKISLTQLFLTQGAVSFLAFAALTLNRRSLPNFKLGRVEILKLKKGLNFSLLSIPVSLSGILLNISDRYIIAYYYEPIYVGYYSVAYSVGSIFFVFIAAMGRSWQPYMLIQLKNNNQNELRKLLRKYIFIVLLALCFLMITKKWLILLLSNSDYLGTVYLVDIILIGIFFYFLYTVYFNLAIYYGEMFIVVIPAILATVINLLLNFMLIPTYGYEMAAYTTLISYFLEFIMILYLSRIRYSFKLLF